MKLAFLSLISLISAFAQTQRALDFRPVDAEWSKSLQAVIAVSSSSGTSHALRILDPVTLTSTAVTLSKAPLSVSVSPDGKFAAVGHDALISYIDLTARTIAKTFVVTGVVDDLVLAADWIHIKGASIRITTGESRAFSMTHFTGARLRADGAAIYATESASQGSVLWKYDVSTGPITAATDSTSKRYSTVYPACDGAWPSADGAWVHTGCGKTFEADLRYATSLPEMGGVRGVAEIPDLKWVAALASTRDAKAKENEVFVFESARLALTNHFVLGDFETAGVKYAARGRWIFAGGSSLYVISQAASGFPLENDFALAEILTAPPAQVCANATFSVPSLSHSFYGEVSHVQIKAPAGCLWNLELLPGNRPFQWFEIHGPKWGSGDWTMSLRTKIRIHDFTNDGQRYTDMRNGSIRMGTQTLTISQGLFGPPTDPTRFNVKFVDADFSTARGNLVVIGSEPPGVLVHPGNLLSYQEAAVARTPLAVAVERSKAPYPEPYYEILLSGTRAAVAQDGWISLYSLCCPVAVEKDLKLPAKPAKLAWPQNGFLYAFAGTDLFSVKVSTGEFQVIRVPKEPKQVIVNNEATLLYADEFRVDISAGFAAMPAAQPSSVACPGPRYFTKKTDLLVDSCGGILSSSADSSKDQLANGLLSAAPLGVLSADYNLAWPGLAVLTPTSAEAGAPVSLQYYDQAHQFIGQRGLAGFSSLQGPYGGDSYKWYGRKVFWNSTFFGSYGTSPWVSVVVQASPDSNLVSDYGVLTYGNSACQATNAQVSNTQFDASGGTGELTITIGQECTWYALSIDSWISFPARRLAVGTSTIPFTIAPNPTTTPRSGTIYAANTQLTVSGTANPIMAKAGGTRPAVTANDRPFSISQRAATTSSPVLSPTSYAASGSAATFNVAVTATGSWTAFSTVNWLVIPNGSTYSGNQTVVVNVLRNSTAAARSGTLIIAGISFPVTQERGTGSLRFFPVTPCRVVDTRNAVGPLGGPAMSGPSERTFPIRSGACGLPADALAYSLNVTIVPKKPFGYLSIYPAGKARPLVSTVNSLDGRVKATAAMVLAGTSGSVTVFVTDDTDVILDVNGYFSPNQSAGLLFYPLAPCRIADTRNSNGPLGGPALVPLVSRTLPVRGVCGIPSTALAYSTNITAVPRGPLGYITVSPTGQTRPTVSTLNAVTGTVTANAAITPAGTNGAIDVFATEATDLVVDVNGYFAPPPQVGSDAGLLFHPLDPCRVADSRNAVGPLGGPVLAPLADRAYRITLGPCDVPSDASAYSMNVTVVPPGPLGYITVWPDGVNPLVSTLNAVDGAITSNAVIVRAGTGGYINLMATQTTHVVIDLNGYFAP